MKDYLRILALLRPYRARVAALVVCILFASTLSSVGVTFISPLVRILFEPDIGAASTQAVEEAPVDAAVSGEKVLVPEGLQSLRHRVLALAEMQAQRTRQAQAAAAARDGEAAQHFLFP